MGLSRKLFNKAWVTAGYKVKRADLLDLCEVYTFKHEE